MADPERRMNVMRKCYGHGVGYLIFMKKHICSLSGHIFSGKQNERFRVNPALAITIRISLFPGILSRVTTIAGVLFPRLQ